MTQFEFTVADHAEMASTILASSHQLAVSGKVDLTEGKTWHYDWALLNALIHRIKAMQTVSECEANTSYNGCWMRREIEIDVHVFGTDYKGTLSVSRSGPGLDRVYWAFEDKTKLPLVA